MVSRLAAGLFAEGVQRGEHVAVLARNSHAFAALRFALARIGAVLVPVNFMLNADEAAYILRHAGAQLLAVDSGLAALGRDAAARDTRVQRLLWLPSEAHSAAPEGMHLRFDHWPTARPRHLSPTSAATTCCRSSTPAAPSRRPKARC